VYSKCLCYNITLEKDESSLQKKPEDQLFARNLEERIMGLLGAMIPEASQVS
jgi:hypothetical protein